MTRNRLLSTILLFPLLLASSSSGCGSAEEVKDERPEPEEHSGRIQGPGGEFGEYWYQGVAEISRFRLEQARYGEIREGDAVMIFVTEDFLTDEQVKLESDPAGREYAKVLKMNLTKNFLTGIYPYSMMTSVFTPVAGDADGRALKVTTSSQEWCGHTYTQVNRAEPGEYRVRQYSYFEKEGDTDATIGVEMLEDELWTRVRIAPKEIPLGTVTMLPGTMTARLRHTEHRAMEADISMSDLPPSDAGAMKRLMVEYPDPVRTLTIDFMADFPHEIVAFSETYNDRGTMLTTTGTRTDTIMIDYWSRNRLADTVLRERLGL